MLSKIVFNLSVPVKQLLKVKKIILKGTRMVLLNLLELFLSGPRIVGQVSLETAQKFPSGGEIKSLGIFILQSAEASIYNIGLFTLVNQVRNILII
jgi:hypothetical protein